MTEERDVFSEVEQAAPPEGTDTPTREAELEMQILALKAGVDPEACEDAVALARQRAAGEKSFDEALKEVLCGYPQLRKSAALTTGVRVEKVSEGEDLSAMRRIMGIK